MEFIKHLLTLGTALAIILSVVSLSHSKELSEIIHGPPAVHITHQRHQSVEVEYLKLLKENEAKATAEELKYLRYLETIYGLSEEK